jgi:hypothetical protein
MTKSLSYYLLVDVILVALSLVAFLPSNVGAGGTLDPPIHIHLTWQQSDTSRTMTVTWQTSYSDSGDTVAYDTVPRNGNRSQYAYSAIGIAHTYSGASGYIHDVELTGLEPETTYYFVCGGEQGGYSSERSFHTAPIGPSRVRFVVGGDCRSNPSQRDIISATMSQFDPSFVLFSGDLVESGVNQAEWDNLLASLQSFWVGTDNRTIPIVPSLGNHEANATAYYEQFALPNNEQWYSFNWGSNVHVTVLNSEANVSGDQLQWLENDLATHQNFTWKFVMFHNSLFSSGTHGSWTETQQYWCPLFDKYGVDVVFSGHDHDYERSKPINYTASKTSPQESYANGTMYLVSGGWGAPLHPNGTNWWTAYSESRYHFVLVDIFANETLIIQAKDAVGSTFDEVIGKTPIIPESPACTLVLISTWLVLPVLMKRKRTRNTPNHNYSQNHRL